MILTRKPMIAATLALILIGIARGPVLAEVYRCEADGKTVYTDQPCAAGAEPVALPPLGRVPAGEASDLADAYDERMDRRRESRKREDARWLQSHRARKEETARFDAAVREKRVLKGMGADHVRRALGSPDDIERAEGRETWTYGTGSKRRRTLVFEDGRLTADRGKSR